MEHVSIGGDSHGAIVDPLASREKSGVITGVRGSDTSLTLSQTVTNFTKRRLTR